MQLQRSPGGSLFPYYYKNGELFCLHFGSYFADEEGVISMMKSEQAFFTSKHRRIGIWIDLYETRLTDRVLRELVQMLAHIAYQTSKLGIVGCSTMDRWRLQRQIKKADQLASLPVKYFADPEVAKTWLVSERE